MTDDAVRAVILACVVLSALVPLAVAEPNGASPPFAAEEPDEFGPFEQQNVDADSVVLDVELFENGTADWRVAYRVELATDNETAAFESLQDDVRANRSTYLSAFRSRMERTARTAENATGREMALRGFEVSTTIESVQQYGTVEYRFSWDGFAATDGDDIRAGDALAGFFLEADSRLTMTWPGGYDATVSPEPDDRRDRSAVWQGPIEFGTAGPSVVAEPSAGGGSFPTMLVVASGLVVFGILIAVWVAARRGVLSLDQGSADEQAPSEASTGGGSEPEPQPEPDEELLSNEERVLRLLDERGGRVKQQEVATEFDWTDAKTSQVVKSLREDDEIDVFRLGRENVIVDPEESDL